MEAQDLEKVLSLLFGVYSQFLGEGIMSSYISAADLSKNSPYAKYKIKFKIESSSVHLALKTNFVAFPGMSNGEQYLPWGSSHPD